DAVSREWSCSTAAPSAFAANAAASVASSPAGKVAEYIDSTEIASPGVPPAAVMSACCVESDTPSLKVTMYDTGGPDGAAAVVVESVEVEAASLVGAAVVSVLTEDALLPAEVEVESLVESVPVAPVKTLTAPPSGSPGSATAPEARTPSTKR